MGIQSQTSILMETPYVDAKPCTVMVNSVFMVLMVRAFVKMVVVSSCTPVGAVHRISLKQSPATDCNSESLSEDMSKRTVLDFKRICRREMSSSSIFPRT